MKSKRPPATTAHATVGVAENGNSAELITLGKNQAFLDRRRIDLTQGLPTHPYHHEGSWAVGRYLATHGSRAITLPEAVALVERVTASAQQGARDALEALASAVAQPIAAISLRGYSPLPPGIADRITDHRAHSYADSAMYREALALAARARGWSVHWYEREQVFAQAAQRVGRADLEGFLREMGRAVGPPWRATHKLAAAAALMCSVPQRRR